MSVPLPKSLALIGAGRMGAALLEGWIRLGLDPAGVVVIEPQPSDALAALCSRFGIALNGAPRPVSVLVLAVKPQMLDGAVAQAATYLGPHTLIVSIMAGKSLADLQARFPQVTAAVRAMPNTPAAIGRGISGAFASPGVSAEQRTTADALLSAVGAVAWLDSEGAIDAVTAVSGSGPAYVFLLAECLAEAGAALGLPPELAMRLARATVEGSGELMMRSAAEPPSRLRENVTSPGGTTAAALAVLMGERGLRPLMRDAVAAAHRRAAELAG